MDAAAILTVSAFVVALTQLVKWAGLPDKAGPIAVMGLSLGGVLFWGWSAGDMTRLRAFSYAAGWLAVTMAASGVYGFTRAGAEALTKVLPPPSDGAGASPTLK